MSVIYATSSYGAQRGTIVLLLLSRCGVRIEDEARTPGRYAISVAFLESRQWVLGEVVGISLASCVTSWFGRRTRLANIYGSQELAIVESRVLYL